MKDEVQASSQKWVHFTRRQREALRERKKLFWVNVGDRTYCCKTSKEVSLSIGNGMSTIPATHTQTESHWRTTAAQLCSKAMICNNERSPYLENFQYIIFDRRLPRHETRTATNCMSGTNFRTQATKAFPERPGEIRRGEDNDLTQSLEGDLPLTW